MFLDSSGPQPTPQFHCNKLKHFKAAHFQRQRNLSCQVSGERKLKFSTLHVFYKQDILYCYCSASSGYKMFQLISVKLRYYVEYGLIALRAKSKKQALGGF